MRNCQRCGVPRILTSENKWDPSGTVSLTRDSTHRMVFLDNDALDHILDSISARIGLPLDPIIVEAKRKSARHFMDALLSGVKGIAVRNFASGKVYDRLGKQINMLGSGRAEVVSYRRRQSLEGIVTDPFNGPCIAGDICGAFESVEGCIAEASFDEDADGRLHIRIGLGEGHRTEYQDRFGFTSPQVITGRNIFELCPVCKAPLTLGADYTFDMDRGIIRENKTGHRVILIGVMTLNNLFGELEAELGQEIPAMIAGIEKDRVRQLILAKGKDLDSSGEGYLRYVKTLRLKGMGNGSSAEVSGDRVTVRVDNPYFEPLVAGFLAGFYEATSGREASVAWTDAGVGYTEVTMEPA